MEHMTPMVGARNGWPAAPEWPARAHTLTPEGLKKRGPRGARHIPNAGTALHSARSEYRYSMVGQKGSFRAGNNDCLFKRSRVIGRIKSGALLSAPDN
jgi:hypothetical protein